MSLVVVARHIAGELWGTPVARCVEVVPGVLTVDTPGHGGIVAILPAATLARAGGPRRTHDGAPATHRGRR